MTRSENQLTNRPGNHKGTSSRAQAASRLACRVSLCAFFALTPDPAWAVQTHGGMEGLISHQLGHSLFTIGMAYLLWRLHRLRLTGPGWLEFRTFLWLLIAWNLVTFCGHWLNEFVAPEQFTKVHARIDAFRIDSLLDGLYYLSRLDHLLLVPSFLFLLMALKKWRLQA